MSDSFFWNEKSAQFSVDQYIIPSRFHLPEGAHRHVDPESGLTFDTNRF